MHLAVAAAALALFAGACSSDESVTLEDLGLDIEVDIEAGTEFELGVPLDPDTVVDVVAAPPGVNAGISAQPSEGSLLLTVAVDPDTPRGAYDLALLVTRNGEEYELGWPFEVVEPVEPTD
jgi:hypothetical protein